MSQATPLLQIRLHKGLAERHRLPLTLLVRILEESGLLLASFAKKIAGDPNIDLQLEIVAGPAGSTFQPGSLLTQLCSPTHPQLAAQAMGQTIQFLHDIERATSDRLVGDLFHGDVLRRLYRIGLQQEKAKSELEFGLAGQAQPTETATLTHNTMVYIRSLQASGREVQGVRVYGKLIELHDRHEEDGHGHGFFGELLLDSGALWRIRFREDQSILAAQFFRQRISVFGDVKYFKTLAPMVIPKSITFDEPKNYVDVFDRFAGSVPELKKVDLDTLVKAVRQED